LALGGRGAQRAQRRIGLLMKRLHERVIALRNTEGHGQR
jgi:hypothetical protein